MMRGPEHPPSWLPTFVHAAEGGVHPAAMHVFPMPHACPTGQSLFVRHCTQVDPFRHCGVDPPQATHEGPQCTFVLHAAHCELLHHSPEGQSPFMLHSAHAPITQP
jgi:hypothetical protein